MINEVTEYEQSLNVAPILLALRHKIYPNTVPPQLQILCPKAGDAQDLRRLQDNAVVDGRRLLMPL
jgi:hypothetical protein